MNRVLLLFPDTPDAVIEFLSRTARVIGPVMPQDDWLTPLRDCDAAIIVVQPPFTGAVMDSAPKLRAMKPTAFLINSARAQVVDEPALIQALRERWIAGAALDVFPTEPPPPDHPLLQMDNVILAPHIGSFTREGMFRMLMQTAEQVMMVLNDQRPPNLVNAAVWEKRRA